MLTEISNIYQLLSREGRRRRRKKELVLIIFLTKNKN